MYSVNQHWDPLKVCAVGQSYPPEFYSFISNTKVRNVMETIAQETEEDYQKLVKLLQSFNVEVIRPTIEDDFSQYLYKGRYMVPPMCPRDSTAMVGEKFYYGGITAAKLVWDRFYSPEVKSSLKHLFPEINDDDLPNESIPLPYTAKDYESVPDLIKGISMLYGVIPNKKFWGHMIEQVRLQGNEIVENTGINSAMLTRVGKDLYHGIWDYENPEVMSKREKVRNDLFPNYRNHIVDSLGHNDGCYCPVVPGLIVSLRDIQEYEKTFPNWEVVYLKDQSWQKVSPFLKVKQKNNGKWWVPGQELNDDFTEFVESWLNHWVGYVEETVFDVNMLVIDQKNVVCNGYNKIVFDALERYGVTPHIVNFRHRYFWDGGLHCITSDLDREGEIVDYFPERG